MTKNLIYRFRKSPKLALLAILSLLIAFEFSGISPAIAGTLTSAKDTIAVNATAVGGTRPSVKTAVGGTITAGDTTITVASSTGILQGDTIKLCDATCATSETKVVANIDSATKIALTAGTTNGYTTAGFVYFLSTAIHTVSFVTRTAASSGKFVFTLPADPTTPNDGLPDTTGFDQNTLGASDITATGFTAGAATISSTSSLITISVPIASGTVAAGTTITLTIGGPSHYLLNPQKTAAAGTADTWIFVVQYQDGSSNVVDQNSGKIATIEAVTITATVQPTLNFTINAVANSTAVAGITTSVTSTTTTVPFGSITGGTSYNIAQYIHVDTNAQSGYIVTASEDGNMRRTDAVTIPDFSTTPTEVQGGTPTSGFGYSLATKLNSPTLQFNYNDTGATLMAAGFIHAPTVGATLMSRTAATAGDEAYVVYHLRVANSQGAGDYRAVVSYVATATY